MNQARVNAAKTMMRIAGKYTYSNVAVEDFLNSYAMFPEDKALYTRLIYGTTERLLTLDYILSHCSTLPVRKMHPAVAAALRVGLYQLVYMDRIPPSAAVNETVECVKALEQAPSAGFVNGVLRSCLRKKDKLLSELPEGIEGDSVRCSCPAPLIEFWRRIYGDELTAGLLADMNEPPPAYIRINTLKISDEEFLNALKASNISYEAVSGLPHHYKIEKVTELKLVNSIKSCYYFQDGSSGFACRAFGARPGERILDVCAAPGGKSFALAMDMENTGGIVAGDLYPKKCDDMANRAAGMGIDMISTVCRDASAVLPKPMWGRFDRVMCDVPCSGLGVIRRKPEIRYKSLDSFKDLPALQLKILFTAAAAVKPGGVLQYSTCTLNPAENERVAEAFVGGHPDFEPRPLDLDPLENTLREPDWRRTLLPPVHGTDGFFIAGFRKVES